jgi:thymidylate synthase
MKITRWRFADLWFDLLESLLEREEVFPRGLPCQEIVNANLEITAALDNILVHPGRKLAYKFMVAEWLWIWFGREDVATIKQYNPRIADFSDNGVDFNGSYGPPITRAWPYVVKSLTQDPDSRQAIINIYRQPSGPTKDVPCTISLQFFIRSGRLHTIATMRSSDIWLGLPYDTFNFSMFGNILASQLGVDVGSLAFNLGSSHLYQRDREAAIAVSKARKDLESLRSPALLGQPPEWMEHVLTTRTSLGMNVYPWGEYTRALLSDTNKEALECLRAL